MNKTHKQALEYIYNTGGFPLIENFIEDHKPTGQELITSMIREGLIQITGNRIFSFSDEPSCPFYKYDLSIKKGKAPR